MGPAQQNAALEEAWTEDEGRIHGLFGQKLERKR